VISLETYPAQEGQMLDRTLGQGVLIDCASGTERNVVFDINNGWSFDGASWGQIVPANTPLSGLVRQAPLQLAEQGGDPGIASVDSRQRAIRW
jgi:hypothetical protein